MLKITKRKDNRSKYWYIRGTYKTPDKVYTINSVSTGKINKKEAEDFLWKFQEKLNLGVTIKKITIKEATEKLLNSLDQCPSDARRPFFEKNANCIGNLLLEDITNQKKEELIHLRYPVGTETGDLIKRYKGKKFTSIPLQERKVLSSKYNLVYSSVSSLSLRT